MSRIIERRSLTAVSPQARRSLAAVSPHTRRCLAAALPQGDEDLLLQIKNIQRFNKIVHFQRQKLTSFLKHKNASSQFYNVKQ